VSEDARSVEDDVGVVGLLVDDDDDDMDDDSDDDRDADEADERSNSSRPVTDRTILRTRSRSIMRSV